MNKNWEQISELFWTELVKINSLPLSESVYEGKISELENVILNISLYINENEIDEYFEFLENNIILNENAVNGLKKIGNKTIDVLDKVNQGKKKVVGAVAKGVTKSVKYLWDNFIPDSVKKMGKAILSKIKEIVVFLVKQAGKLIKKAIDEIANITKKIIPEKYRKNCEKGDVLKDSLSVTNKNKIILEGITETELDKYFTGFDFKDVRSKINDSYKFLSYLVAELKKIMEKNGNSKSIDSSDIGTLIKYIGKKGLNTSDYKFSDINELNRKLLDNDVPFYVRKYYKIGDISADKVDNVDVDKTDGVLCNIGKTDYLKLCSKKHIDTAWKKMNIDKFMTLDEFVETLGNRKMYIISAIISVGTSIGLAAVSGGVLPIARLVSLFAFVLAPMAVEFYANVLENRGQKEAAEFYNKLASALRGLSTIVSITRIIENLFTMIFGGGNVDDVVSNGDMKGHDIHDIHNLKQEISDKMFGDVDVSGHAIKMKWGFDHGQYTLKAVVDGQDITDKILQNGYDIKLLKHICSQEGDHTCGKIMMLIHKGVPAQELNSEMQKYVDVVSELEFQQLDSILDEYKEKLAHTKNRLEIRRLVSKLYHDVAKTTGISETAGLINGGFYEHFIVDGKDIGGILNVLKNEGVLDNNYGNMNFDIVEGSRHIGSDVSPNSIDYDKIKEYAKLTKLIAKYSDDPDKLHAELYKHKDEFKDFVNQDKILKIVGKQSDMDRNADGEFDASDFDDGGYDNGGNSVGGSDKGGNGEFDASDFDDGDYDNDKNVADVDDNTKHDNTDTKHDNTDTKHDNTDTKPDNVIDNISVNEIGNKLKEIGFGKLDRIKMINSLMKLKELDKDEYEMVVKNLIDGNCRSGGGCDAYSFNRVMTMMLRKHGVDINEIPNNRFIVTKDDIQHSGDKEIDNTKSSATQDENGNKDTSDDVINDKFYDVDKILDKHQLNLLKTFYGDDFIDKIQYVCDVDKNGKFCEKALIALKVGIRGDHPDTNIPKLIKYINDNFEAVKNGKSFVHSSDEISKLYPSLSDEAMNANPFDDKLATDMDLLNSVHKHIDSDTLQKLNAICQKDEDYCDSMYNKISFNRDKLGDEKYVNYLKTTIEQDYDRIVSHHIAQGVEKINDEYNMIKAKSLAGIKIDNEEIEKFRNDVKDYIGDGVKAKIDVGFMGSPDFKEFVVDSKDYSNILNKISDAIDKDFAEDLNKYLNGKIDLDEFEPDRLKEIKHFVEGLKASNNGEDFVKYLDKHKDLFKKDIDFKEIDVDEIKKATPIMKSDGLLKQIDDNLWKEINSHVDGDIKKELGGICDNSYGLCKKYLEYMQQHRDELINGDYSKSTEKMFNSLSFVEEALKKIKEDETIFDAFRNNCDSNPKECLKYLKAATYILDNDKNIDMAKVPSKLVKYIEKIANYDDSVKLVNKYAVDDEIDF